MCGSLAVDINPDLTTLFMKWADEMEHFSRFELRDLLNDVNKELDVADENAEALYSIKTWLDAELELCDKQILDVVRKSDAERLTALQSMDDTHLEELLTDVYDYRKGVPCCLSGDQSGFAVMQKQIDGILTERFAAPGVF